jgi:LCP family protein required for cell wall assembly
VVYQLTTFRKNDVAVAELDLPGAPAPTLPPDTAPPDTQPPSTVALPVVIPGTGVPGEAAPTTLPTLNTVPGEGSCEEEVACAQAPVVSLTPAEQPRQGNLLVDKLPEDPIGGPNAYNILVVGTDSRADVPEKERHRFGKVAGQRSDTIMILRISPDGKTAAILSIPRDTYVHISGKRKNDRINSAYAVGIPTLVATVRENFNIAIRHVLTVDFSGFEKIVGTLGGVQVCFDKPARDSKTGLDQPAGCNMLDSKQATGYVRARQYEQFDGTTWKTDGRGDLGRIDRQQKFIRSVLQKAIDAGFTNPLQLNALIGDVKDSVTLDQSFDISTIFETARTFSNFQPGALQTYIMPTDYARINGKAVLRVKRAEASQLVSKFGARR